MTPSQYSQIIDLVLLYGQAVGTREHKYVARIRNLGNSDADQQFQEACLATSAALDSVTRALHDVFAGAAAP